MAKQPYDQAYLDQLKQEYLDKQRIEADRLALLQNARNDQERDQLKKQFREQDEIGALYQKAIDAERKRLEKQAREAEKAEQERQRQEAAIQSAQEKAAAAKEKAEKAEAARYDREKQRSEKQAADEEQQAKSLAEKQAADAQAMRNAYEARHADLQKTRLGTIQSGAERGYESAGVAGAVAGGGSAAAGVAMSAAVAILGKSLAGMASAITRPIVNALAPVSLVNAALAQTGSGLGVFQSAVSLLGATLAPMILPVFVALAAAVVAASDFIWEKLLPVLGDWYNLIFGTAIPAIRQFCEALQNGATDIAMGIAKALGVVDDQKDTKATTERDPAKIAEAKREMDRVNKEQFAAQLNKPGGLDEDWLREKLKGQMAPDSLRVAPAGEDAAAQAARTAALKSWLIDAYNKQIDGSAAARTEATIKAQAGTDTAVGQQRRADLEKRLEDPAEMAAVRRQYGLSADKTPGQFAKPADPETSDARAARETQLRKWVADRVEAAEGLRPADSRTESGKDKSFFGMFRNSLGVITRDLQKDVGTKATYSGLSQVNMTAQLAALNDRETDQKMRERALESLSLLLKGVEKLVDNTERPPSTVR